MKKLIYLCLLAFLTVNFGCEKEVLYAPEIEQNSESSENNDNLDSLNRNMNSEISDYEINTNNTSNVVGIYDQYGIPHNVEAVALYLDMTAIQLNYSGFYTGAFSEHYRNVMSAHFTIYSIQYGDPMCGNIERWIVNKQEYNNYSGGIDEDGIIAVLLNGNNGGNSSTTNTNNANNTNSGSGVEDNNGNVPNPKGKVKPMDSQPTGTIIEVPGTYRNCF